VVKQVHEDAYLVVLGLDRSS